MPVFRDLDQESLDKQYNNRAAVPQHPAILARWAADAAAFRQAHAVQEDLCYASDPKQTLDYFPAGGPGRPLLIFIHGGYWQALDKSDSSHLAAPYLARGIDVAVLNYRLAPQATMAEIVRDNRGAVVWLHRNARVLGFDAERVFVSGHSAGGQLVGMLAGTQWQDFGLPADVLKGACSISGLYDLEPIRLCYLNRVIGLTEADVAAYSPMRHPPTTTLPMILTVGGDESAEYHRQQDEYAALLRQRGVPVRIVVQTGGHHFDALDRLGDAQSELAAAVLAMIEAAA
ncbi:alpha/beta hydrolase [Cupriavidus gilardii]|uniref:alpha/beta hydrolase n=1 Tax=Cupriavidus gilardii TaxID=82541 RepID=UPI001580C959|nr:alpha/beta hydrolase [Cupriavidus gilardii]MCT9070382.1 alpha/beta hydrolase [Cupriavidus gilardii]QKS61226.1 alpha/beta hydrolase [Cupriavidus gilardii]